MSKEVEKAIEKLNSIVKVHNRFLKGCKEEKISEKEIEALETVLNYIKELEETLKCTQNSWYNDTKKIQELKEENEIYKNELKKVDKALNVKVGIAMPTSSDIIESMKKSVIQLKMIAENSIPKQVIRDKIEEIENDKDYKYYDMFLHERDIENTIQVLQELLEEE